MNNGFTLLEIVIVLGITALLVGAVMAFQSGFFGFNSSFQQSLMNQQQAQGAIEEIARELRAAALSDGGAYPIEMASTTAVTFYANIDQDASREKMRYFLEGGALKKGVTEAAGTPPVYDPAGESVKTLVYDVAATATPLFAYYDRNFAGTSSPLSPPINVPDIRLIKVVIVIDRDPALPPPATIVESRVMLRNLKDN